MRIAVVSAYKRYTGATLAARVYFNAFQHLGHAPSWYQCVSSEDRENWDTNGNVIQGWTPLGDSFNLVLDAFTVFPRRLASLTEELVFLSDPILLNVAPRVPRSVLLVHDMREFDPQRRSWLATRVYRRLYRHLDRVDQIICVSHATEDRLRAIARPRCPVVTVHHCAQLSGDPDAHLATSLRRLQDQREINIGYLAADRPYKQVEFFARLASQLREPYRGVSFRFHLLSELRPETKRRIDALPGSNLSIYSRVDDLEQFYAAVDVLAHPSQEEGMGLPVVEAMQFGIPIVGANIPALREIVGPGGTLVDGLDLERWASPLRDLTDAGSLAAASRASRDRAPEFSPGAFEARVRAVFPEPHP
jgi:glycosyltransferase involved in cell wall biosynthesis